MKSYFYIFFLIAQLAIGQNSRLSVIIDSDAGIDDYRAIIFFAKLNTIDIKAITLSDGTLFPDKGAIRVNKLMNCLNIKNVFIGVGRKTMFTKPVWRSFAEKIPWGDCELKDSITEYPNATQIINKILDESSPKSTTIICLGSLSNLYESLMINPTATNKIKEVIWYNSGNIKQGINYTFEPKAAEYILSQSIKIKIIYPISGKYINYDTAFINEINSVKNKNAHLIVKQLHYISMQSNVTYLQSQDELCAAYIVNPGVFTFKEKTEKPQIQILYNYDVNKIKKTFISILSGNY